MNRPLSAIGLLLALVAVVFLFPRTCHGPGASRWSGGSPSGGDSSRVVAVRDSLDSGWADARRRFHNLQTWIDAAPADTVWRVVRRLVRDTVDTGRVDTLRLVSALVVDDSACRVDRDSLRGEAALWQARDAAHAEAYRIAQERPQVVGDTNPPSRVTWAAVGAAGALAGVTAIILLGGR